MYSSRRGNFNMAKSALDQIMSNFQVGVSNLFGGGKKPISPLSAMDTLDEDWKVRYTQDQMNGQARATQNPGPQTYGGNQGQIKVPETFSNAPNAKQKNALQVIRQANPENKMSDAEIISYYNKYGDKLLRGLPAVGTSTTAVVKTPVRTNAVMGAQTNQNPSPNAVTTGGSRPLNMDVKKFLEEVVFPVTRAYQIHDAAAAGQFAAEGRLDGVGASLNNHFNVGFTDSKADSGDYSTVPKYDTPKAGVEAYARFITGQADDEMYANGVDGSKWGKIGKKQLQEIYKKYKNNPEQFLKMISPMYSSLGSEYARRTMNTPEYRTYR